MAHGRVVHNTSLRSEVRPVKGDEPRSLLRPVAPKRVVVIARNPPPSRSLENTQAAKYQAGTSWTLSRSDGGRLFPTRSSPQRRAAFSKTCRCAHERTDESCRSSACSPPRSERTDAARYSLAIAASVEPRVLNLYLQRTFERWSVFGVSNFCNLLSCRG